MSAKNKKKLMPKLLLTALILLLAALGLFLLSGKEAAPGTEPENTGSPAETQSATEILQEGPVIQVNDGLVITAAGNYTGIYMEDGSDEAVTGILKIHLTNISEEAIQYARITMNVDGEEALFTVTALPAGATAVLLEQNRMEYREDVDYMTLTAKCENLALFDKALSLHEDKLQIQTLDGALNITNVSGGDINGTIILCYKGWQNGMYYGGIGYRIRLEGGMKAGELRQIMAEHYMEPGSRLVFVDIVE